jgi:hypothetical protein
MRDEWSDWEERSRSRGTVRVTASDSGSERVSIKKSASISFLASFLSSWFESLAVASHPLQPDWFFFVPQSAFRGFGKQFLGKSAGILSMPKKSAPHFPAERFCVAQRMR